MRWIALIILSVFLSVSAYTALPPTSTRGSAGGNYNTTFKFDFPYIPITQSGTLATFGQIPLGSGVSGNLPLANMASIADGTVLSNISGGATTPSANTVDDILDDYFGNTQGSVIYRGASDWAALGPGTNGEFLKTQGAGANPDWDTPTDTGITELTGDVTAGPGSGTQAATIAANAVSNAKFRQSSGLSVVGRAANSTGDVADITAANDAEVLRRSGTSIGFGELTFASIPQITSYQVYGNPTGSTADAQSTSITSLLDGAFSSTQGSILYRASGQWQALGPGTDGQLLETNGAGFDPSWATVATGGNVSTVTGAGRVVAAALAGPSGGSCAVNSEIGGDWINGTPSSAGTGRCSITFQSGVFSGSVAPVCFCAGAAGAGNMRECQGTADPSTSSWDSILLDAAGSAVDSSRTLICFGLQP